MEGFFRGPVVEAGNWYNLRSFRERLLMLITVLVVLLLVGWNFAIAPIKQEFSHQENRLKVLEAHSVFLAAQKRTLERQFENNPSVALIEKLNARRQKLDYINGQIAQVADGVVSPTDMVELLREIFTAQSDLRLEGLYLKKPIPIYGPQKPPINVRQSEPLLYAHDVELRIKGGYREVLRYLKRLEILGDRLGLLRLEYNVENWPVAEAVIQVRTLSLKKFWLGI